MATPRYQAATPGQTAFAGHVDQFLGVHQMAVIYPGTVLATDGGTSTGAFLALKPGTPSLAIPLGINEGDFPAAQVTYVTLWAQSVGGGADVVAQLWSDNGSPAGAGMPAAPYPASPQSVIVPAGFVPGSAAAVSFPLLVNDDALLLTLPYLVLWSPNSTSSSYIEIGISTATGTDIPVTNATAPPPQNATTWTSLGHKIVFQVLGPPSIQSLRPVFYWEDGGARWTALSWDASNTNLTAISEVTNDQVGSAFASTRALSLGSGSSGREPGALS